MQSSYLSHPPDSNSIAAAALVASNNRNRRRTRIKFDTEQIDLLESAFQKTHYPDVNVVDQLSNKLNISNERISVWFQNRRARFKKEKHHFGHVNEEFSKKDFTTSLITEHEINKCDRNQSDEEKNKSEAKVEIRSNKVSRNIHDVEKKSKEQKEKEIEKYSNHEINSLSSNICHKNLFQTHVYSNSQLNGFVYPNFVYPYMLDQRHYDAYSASQQFTTPVESKENSLIINSRPETPILNEKKNNQVDEPNNSNKHQHHLGENSVLNAEINSSELESNSEQNSEEKEVFFLVKLKRIMPI